jgi:hypothetical protein
MNVLMAGTTIGTTTVAVLLPVLTGGSFPPEITAVFVILGLALASTWTFIVIGEPLLLDAITLELVQVIV